MTTRYAAPLTRKGTREMIWDAMIWTGAGISALGLAGLIACIVIAIRSKRSGLPDAEMRARLKSLVALNLAALSVSALGLAVIVVGILLG